MRSLFVLECTGGVERPLVMPLMDGVYIAFNDHPDLMKSSSPSMIVSSRSLD
jgi:hypothetical protein